MIPINSTLEKLLLDFSRSALRNSYAPYSGIRVGAAIFNGKHFKCEGYETNQGGITTGCNIENASYGLTMCAERVAMFSAIKEGLIREETPFIAMGIVVDADKSAMPCGACLQVMSELAKMYKTNPIIYTSICDFSVIERTTLNDLLPKPFEIR